MRSPAVAGQFYPKNAEDLKRQLDELLGRATAEAFSALGAVIPHAGYIYSGAIAAEGYACLPKRETYVLLGPNHHGLGAPVALSIDSWKTPLGIVEADVELAASLAGSIIDADESAHRSEHSLEVQIPFLQRRFADFRILPVSMGLQDMETAVEVGEALGKAVRSLNRSCTVIASSDFTHYESQEIARKIDASLIESILRMDIQEFYSRVYSYNATACGYGPIAAAMAASSSLGAKAGKLLRYATSGDVTGDYSQVVGYGAIAFM